LLQVALVVEKSTVESIVEFVAEPSATTHEERVHLELSEQAEDKPRPSRVDWSEEAAAVETIEMIGAEVTAQTQEDQIVVQLAPGTEVRATTDHATPRRL